ncbi:F0F1 ATP synthase subunit epsilon [Fusibacter tunisiensis]|jgi:F-type H+-transporting ATPase subunit epsilon|uniref:ATP synthase epsilon chain n=1 Tax=Fusibacter tunisiensis TaxID=1008308 RepID=A0ABS2MPI6_9FIRM|nr:F0F1 ATP synthase subunit epsilon [Fusibacter tunisiensis]MBM7561305.1 F-type H+-transporting ATPase subunit epsilon [Fusibacter tunisiensis]
MGSKFKLNVVTPDRDFFSGETEMAIVRTTEGDLGILYDHEPLVAPLRIGSMRIKMEDGSFKWAACSSGFITVNDSDVTMLVDSAEWVEEIDMDRALEAKKRAEERIREGDAKEIDIARAQAALERAINRIKMRDVRK